MAIKIIKGPQQKDISFPKLVLSPTDNAKAAEAALTSYLKWEGGTREPTLLLTEFLTDLMHWADKNEVNFHEVLVTAKKDYYVNVKEDMQVCMEVKADLAAEKAVAEAKLIESDPEYATDMLDGV